MPDLLAPPAPVPRPAARSAWAIQRAVLFALLVRELKTRFGGRWIGGVWFVLEPLAHVLMMVAMFGVMHQAVSPSIDYPVFVVTGMLPFFTYRSLTMRLMEGIDANRALFSYRQVKPMDPLVSRAVLEVALHVAIFVLALAVLAWWGDRALPDEPLEFVGVFALLSLFGFSLGTLLAVLSHDFLVLRSMVRLVFFPLYLLSGVMFPIHAMPPDVVDLLLWNPVLHLIEEARGHFFASYPMLPEVNLAYPALWTLVCTVLALALYRLRRLRLSAAA